MVIDLSNEKINKTPFWKNVEYYMNLLHMSKDSVYRSERWGKNITVDTMYKISDALDVPLSKLFEDKETSLQLAYDQVCDDLNIKDKNELKNIVLKREKFKKQMNKLINEYEY